MVREDKELKEREAEEAGAASDGATPDGAHADGSGGEKDSTGAYTASGKRIVPFDPRKPNRLNRKQRENLSSLFEEAAEHLSVALGKDLRVEIQAEVKGISQESGDVFTASRARPTCIYVVQFAPLKFPTLVILDHVFVFSGVDRFLGGTGDVEIEPRVLTEVEKSITDHFIEVINRSMVAGWKKIVALEPLVLNHTSDPDRLEEEGQSDLWLLTVLEIKGAADFGTVTLCFPFKSLQEYLDRIETLKEAKDPTFGDLEEWEQRLETHLRRVEVGLPIFLGDTEISLREIIDLKKDDVIVLGRRIQEPVEMPVGRLAVVSGNIGVYNNRLALKVLSIRRCEDAAEEVETAHG